MAKKPSFKLPHTLVLIYILVIGVYVLSLVVPSGEFKRTEKTFQGQTRLITVPGTYSVIPKHRLGPQWLLIAPIRGFQDAALIIFLIFIFGGTIRSARTNSSLFPMTAIAVPEGRGEVYYSKLDSAVERKIGDFSLTQAGIGSVGETVMDIIIIGLSPLLVAGYDHGRLYWGASHSYRDPYLRLGGEGAGRVFRRSQGKKCVQLL